MARNPFIHAGLRVLLRIAKYHTLRPAIRKRAPPCIGGGAAMRALTRRIDIELYHLQPEANPADIRR